MIFFWNFHICPICSFSHLRFAKPGYSTQRVSSFFKRQLDATFRQLRISDKIEDPRTHPILRKEVRETKKFYTITFTVYLAATHVLTYLDCLASSLSLHNFCWLWYFSLHFSALTRGLARAIYIKEPKDRRGSLHHRVGNLCQANHPLRLVSSTLQRIYIVFHSALLWAWCLFRDVANNYCLHFFLELAFYYFL